MLTKQRALRAALLVGLGLGGAGGCLIVSPLDDLPASVDGSAGGTNAGGESAGGKSTGGTAAGKTSSGGSAAAEAGGGTQAGRAGAGGGCLTNAECVRRSADDPYRCRPSDHTCVALKNGACPLAYGDAADPNAIYFGAFATLNPVAPEDNSIIWSHLTALDDLSGDQVGGLPGVAKGPRRPLVMTVCNNAKDVVEAGLAHLVEDVQVPAIIATLKGGDLRRGFEKYRANHDTFYLSPVSVTTTVANETDDGLIWGLLGQPSDFVPTYTELLKLAEKRLRKERDMQPGDQLKVALVTTKDAFDSELAIAVEQALVFNSLSASDNGANYFPVTLNGDDPKLKTQLETTAQDIIDFGPDVVISTASELFSMDGGLLQNIDLEWGGTQDKPRPFYVLSPYNAGDLNRAILLMNNFIEAGVETDPEQRFVGVSVAGARDNTLQNAYSTHLRTLFKDAYFDTANYYDATYFLAYAMVAAGSETELSGSRIASGMQRLLSGPSYNVGPDDIGHIFDALSAGTNVHVASTLGPPDFDPKTGVRSVDGGVLCFERVGDTVQRQTDVLRYDHDQAAFTGTFPCFGDFYP